MSDKPTECPSFWGKVFGHNFVIEKHDAKTGKLINYVCSRCGMRI